MKYIVSLIIFLFCLLTGNLPKKETVQPEPEKNGSKYDAIMGGPSEPFVTTEPIFCPVCHQLVTYIRREKDTIEMVTGNNNRIRFSTNKEDTVLPIKCPQGHTVRMSNVN